MVRAKNVTVRKLGQLSSFFSKQTTQLMTFFLFACMVSACVPVILSVFFSGIALIVTLAIYLVGILSIAWNAIEKFSNRMDEISVGIDAFCADTSFRFKDSGNGFSDIKETEADLNKLFNNISNTEKTQYQFSREISGEFKVPLVSLSVIIEGILSGVMPADREHLLTMSNDVKKMKNSIDTLLCCTNLGDVKTHTPVRCDLSEPFIASYERTKRIIDSEKLNIDVGIITKASDDFSIYATVDPSLMDTLFGLVVSDSLVHATYISKIEFAILSAYEPISGKEMIKLSIADDRTQTSEVSCDMKDSEQTIIEMIMAASSGHLDTTYHPGKGYCTSMWFPISENIASA